LGGLWALEWVWQIAETNLRCIRSSGMCMLFGKTKRFERLTDSK